MVTTPTTPTDTSDVFSPAARRVAPIWHQSRYGGKTRWSLQWCWNVRRCAACGQTRYCWRQLRLLVATKTGKSWRVRSVPAKRARGVKGIPIPPAPEVGCSCPASNGKLRRLQHTYKRLGIGIDSKAAVIVEGRVADLLDNLVVGQAHE